MDKFTTTSYKNTQKLGIALAKEVLKTGPQKKAVVLALFGNLGGGKTTFIQGFAKGLGVKNKILSPTFVIMKNFKIPRGKFKFFYHIDCYRMGSGKDVLHLGLKGVFSDPKNIVAVEWPEKIKKILPKTAVKINFKFIGENKREISFKK